MATPRIPPDIAKKIAAMKPDKPAPVLRAPAASAPAAARPATPAATRPVVGLMTKVAAVGWGCALLAVGAAFFFYKQADQMKVDALAAQAAQYDEKLKAKDAEIKKTQDEAAATVKRAQDEAAGKLVSLQTELDFQKMPDLPLETVPRANQVLYVNNNSEDTFFCKLRLSRQPGNLSKEADFTIKGHTFQDLGAVGDWVFAKGDKVDFIKPGYKPRSVLMQ